MAGNKARDVLSQINNKWPSVTTMIWTTWLLLLVNYYYCYYFRSHNVFVCCRRLNYTQIRSMYTALCNLSKALVTSQLCGVVEPRNLPAIYGGLIFIAPTHIQDHANYSLQSTAPAPPCTLYPLVPSPHPSRGSNCGYIWLVTQTG
jgi:hypothetical protein